MPDIQKIGQAVARRILHLHRRFAEIARPEKRQLRAAAIIGVFRGIEIVASGRGRVLRARADGAGIGDGIMADAAAEIQMLGIADRVDVKA